MKTSLWQRMLRAWSVWSGRQKPVMALPCNRIDPVAWEEAELNAQNDYLNHLHRLIMVDTYSTSYGLGVSHVHAKKGQPFVVQVMETCTQDLTRGDGRCLDPVWDVKVIASHGCEVGESAWIKAPTHRIK